MNTLEDLRDLCGSTHQLGSEYERKQIHKIPDAPVVDRVAFILERCKGKRVLDVGASGPLHEAIKKVAQWCVGIDHPRNDKGESRPGAFYVDLDSRPILPNRPVDLVVCGEVVEHLSNPGRFLDALIAMYPKTPVIITVPNAFSDAGRKWVEGGSENCNHDHTAWFSHRTLKTLVERAGYAVKEMAWYNGRPRFSEGLIFVVEGV